MECKLILKDFQLYSIIIVHVTEFLSHMTYLRMHNHFIGYFNEDMCVDKLKKCAYYNCEHKFF